MMNNLLAQINFGPDGGNFGCTGNSILCSNFVPTESGNVLNTVLSTVIAVMTVIAFIWFVIQFFIGALGIISAGGDKAKMADARAKITTGLIGLIVVIAAIFIIQLVGTILGLNILNPGNFVTSLSL